MDSYKETVLPYVILLNNLVTVVMAGLAVFFTINLIKMNFFKRLASSFSPTISFYFLFAFISGCITFSHTAYLLVLWRPDVAIYNAIILYTTGSVATQFQAGVPVIEFFLCIDRCLTVIFLSRYDTPHRYRTAALSIGTLITLMVTFTVTTKVIDNIPQDPKTSCRIFGCFKSSSALIYTVVQKCAIAAANCFAALYLGYLMKTRITTSHTIKRLNKVLLHSLVVAFFCDFIPNMLGAIGLVFSIRFNDVIGPYSNTLTTTNIAISCYLYWKMFKKTLMGQVELTSSAAKQHTIWITNN